MSLQSKVAVLLYSPFIADLKNNQNDKIWNVQMTQMTGVENPFFQGKPDL